jgi:hypothetical protein
MVTDDRRCISFETFLPIEGRVRVGKHTGGHYHSTLASFRDLALCELLNIGHYANPSLHLKGATMKNDHLGPTDKEMRLSLSVPFAEDTPLPSVQHYRWQASNRKIGPSGLVPILPVIGTNSSQPVVEKSFPILRITEDHSTFPPSFDAMRKEFLPR